MHLNYDNCNCILSVFKVKIAKVAKLLIEKKKVSQMHLNYENILTISNRNF